MPDTAPLMGQEPIERRKISRRTVVAGAAWAVPAISIASALPNAAASVAPCTPTGSVATNSVVWDVGSRFTGCTTHADHPDYILKFNFNGGDCPDCMVGGVSRTINAFRIIVTLNHAWGYWIAWDGGETLSRTYYVRSNTAFNCANPGTPNCTIASYTSAGIASNGTWTDANAKCNNGFILVPNSGDTGYDCHATDAVDDGIHINPCYWDTHNDIIDVPFTYQPGYESTPGNSGTFTPCTGSSPTNGTIRLSNPN